MECLICLRDMPLTRHHLIPVTRHKNKKTCKQHTKERLQEVIMLCRHCHNQIHALISEKEMDETYNTFELLSSNHDVAKFTEWIRKRQPTGKISVKSSKSRRRKK